MKKLLLLIPLLSVSFLFSCGSSSGGNEPYVISSSVKITYDSFYESYYVVGDVYNPCDYKVSVSFNIQYLNSNLETYAQGSTSLDVDKATKGSFKGSPQVRSPYKVSIADFAWHKA